jgi:arginyl-tRNA--protein-N-Asp/Glu arginylyltransferase
MPASECEETAMKVGEMREQKRKMLRELAEVRRITKKADIIEELYKLHGNYIMAGRVSMWDIETLDGIMEEFMRILPNV